MFFFTSDTHFGHENILKFCNRPFSSVEEMNEALIANWNAKVRGNDTVFILGDMFFRIADAEPILMRLKGKKRLILGNHDGSWVKKLDLGRYFESIDDFLVTSDGQHGLTLCHYPLLTWAHQKRTYMVHGHIHNDTTSDYWPLIAARDHVLNAGCDVNHFEPVTFEEMAENNARFKAAHAPSQTSFPC